MGSLEKDRHLCNAWHFPPGTRPAPTRSLCYDVFQPVVSYFIYTNLAHCLLRLFLKLLKMMWIEAVKCPPVHVLHGYCLCRYSTLPSYWATSLRLLLIVLRLTPWALFALRLSSPAQNHVLSFFLLLAPPPSRFIGENL